MAVNWNAIQSLSKARPGATPPLLGASNANPAVAALGKSKEVLAALQSLGEAQIGATPPLLGASNVNPAVAAIMQSNENAQMLQSLGEAQIGATPPLLGASNANPAVAALGKSKEVLAALQSLGEAQIGATPPLLGASNANPAVAAMMQSKENAQMLQSLGEAQIGATPPLLGASNANPAVAAIMQSNENAQMLQSLGEAQIGDSLPLQGASNAHPAVAAQMENISQTEQQGAGCLFVAKNALNGGELSPYLAARFDQPRWLTGCRRLRNLTPLPQGGITRRPGLRSVRALPGAPNESRAVFIPFVFGQGQERMLELVGTASGSSLNVYDPDGVAIRLNALSLPYKMQHLADLSYAQSADVLYLAHQGYKPAKIMRYGDNDWRFGYLEFLPEITAPSVLLARAVGEIPSGEKSRTHYDYVVTAIDAETAEESLASATARVNDAAPLSQTYYIELRIAPKENASEYRVYKKGGGVFGYVGRVDASSELAPAETVDNVEIPASYIFEDRNIAGDTEDTPPNARDPFSESGIGNPALVFLHQQRLGFAASSGRPMTIWLSQSGNYESMSASIPPKDDDAIEVTMGASQVNRIIWCKPDRNGLGVGTQGGEWILEGADGVAITPGNLMFKAQTSHGSQWGLPALMTGSGIIYAQTGGRVVRQFSYSFSSDKYESTELTLLARHILDGPNRQITGWAWQGEPYGIAWCVLGDGTMAGLTFLPEQEITAWHRHDTAGQLENIAAIRGSDGYDRVWFHVIRNGVRHIEIMRPFRRESDAADSADYVDGAASAAITCECVPYLPETNLQNGSTWMRVRKLNAIKADVVCSRPFMAAIGNAPALPVPVREKGFAARGQWALPIAGGWREDADLTLTFPGNGPATVLGLLATLELAELSGNQM